MRPAIILLSIFILNPSSATAKQPKELQMLAEQIVPKVRIEDDAEFFQLWNLEHPGLGQVQSAIQVGDLGAAKVALKAYFLQRKTIQWEVNHWDMPTTPQGPAKDHPKYQEGEDVLAHQFSSHGFTVDHGDKIDWNYFPITKPNGQTDYEYGLTHNINRFFHFTAVLGPLYWFTRDERYAKEFVYEVTDFVQSWPAPEQYWSTAPGPWRQLTSAVPLNGSWFTGYNHFLPSESFTPEAHTIMLKGFIEKARFAVRNPNAVNRYMLQLSGIYNVGAYFPELKEARNLRTFAEQAMEATLIDEFYPDTISKELCPGYHGTSRHAVRRLVDSAILMGYEPSPVLLDGLAAIYDFYPKVATPLGGIPHFGDTGVSNNNILGKTFSDIIDLIDKPVYRWFASQQEKGHPPNFTSTHLPWAGFYIMRSGWDRNAMYLCLDAGPLGKGHWHEDLLNFECYAYGEPLVSEVGVYSYVSDEWSAYFRSAHAHNTILVDGMGQIRTGYAPLEIDTPRKNDWHSDNVFDLAWGLYDGQWSNHPTPPRHTAPEASTMARDPITHRRDICFVKNSYWIINDRLTGPGEHNYSQLFHFQPDRDLQIINNHRVETTNTNRANVAFVQTDPVTAKIITGEQNPLQGWYSAGQRKKQPAPVLSFDQKKTDTARYDTVMLPLDKNQTANISVARREVTEAGKIISPNQVCALHIQTAQGIDLYLNDLRQDEIGPLNGQSKQVDDLITDARTAVIRLNRDGTLKKASAVGATFISYKGQNIAFKNP